MASRRRRDDSVQDGIKPVFRYAFGVQGPLRNNVLFVNSIDEESGNSKERILYPVGQHVVLYKPEDNEMQFMKGT
jgi:hypothetical protein